MKDHSKHVALQLGLFPNLFLTNNIKWISLQIYPIHEHKAHISKGDWG